MSAPRRLRLCGGEGTDASPVPLGWLPGTRGEGRGEGRRRLDRGGGGRAEPAEAPRGARSGPRGGARVPPPWVGAESCFPLSLRRGASGFEERLRRSGLGSSNPEEGPGPNTRQREAIGLQWREVGALGPTTLSPQGGDVLASPGTERILPAPIPDPPPATRVTQPGAPSSPPLAPQDPRTRWEFTRRSLCPAGPLVPAIVSR